MNKITKESVIAEREKTPRRRQYTENLGLNGARFFVPFETIKFIFEEETKLNLNKISSSNFYYNSFSDEEIKIIKNWIAAQGNIVFLRDCLPLSVALDMNFVGEDKDTKTYTQMGKREHEGKENQNKDAIGNIASEAIKQIQRLPFYKDADLICAIPPAPDKIFDLPSAVVKIISEKIDKPNITSGFNFSGEKISVKSALHGEKWDIWEEAQIAFQNSEKFDVNGKTIILVDDKYQSGTTIQYIAMKLQEAGASKIYGLSFVKTWSDSDNR